MSRKAKLLAKAIRNPKSLRFSDFETLLRSCGWSFDHQTGSHQIWRSPSGARLSIQPTKEAGAKGYQVEQFLEQQKREQPQAEDERNGKR